LNHTVQLSALGSQLSARKGGDPDAGIASTSLRTGLLVQGDNLLALKALLPYYAGKVKCIYKNSGM